MYLNIDAAEAYIEKPKKSYPKSLTPKIEKSVSDLSGDKVSSATTRSNSAADDSYEHYTKNTIVKRVVLRVPFPTECPNCAYNGFTEVAYRDNARSTCLKISIFGFFCLGSLFNVCQKQRTSCFNSCKSVDHVCFKCKTLLAQENKKKARKVDKKNRLNDLTRVQEEESYYTSVDDDDNHD
jgi:hypothetical protein